MELSLLLFVIALVPSCNALPIEEKWELWKEQHAKTYLNGKEEFQKRVTWAKNVEFIQDFNRKENSYSLTINRFTDMVRVLIQTSYNVLDKNITITVS